MIHTTVSRILSLYVHAQALQGGLASTLLTDPVASTDCHEPQSAESAMQVKDVRRRLAKGKENRYLSGRGHSKRVTVIKNRGDGSRGGLTFRWGVSLLVIRDNRLV